MQYFFLDILHNVMYYNIIMQQKGGGIIMTDEELKARYQDSEEFRDVLGNRTRPTGQGPVYHTSSPYLRSADYDTALAGEDDECAQGELRGWKRATFGRHIAR